MILTLVIKLSEENSLRINFVVELLMYIYCALLPDARLQIYQYLPRFVRHSIEEKKNKIIEVVNAQKEERKKNIIEHRKSI